jgi:hypothetical protein
MKIQLKPSCCLPGSDCCKETKILIIDFLYLDLSICERCQGSNQNLLDALDLLKPILNKLGYQIKLNQINVNTEELAIKHQFLSSPTIRVNHQDIELSVKEDNCTSCGDLCGDTVDCRVFSYNGKDYHEPPVEMIIDRILSTLYKPTQIKKSGNYTVPDNLTKFYQNINKN